MTLKRARVARGVAVLAMVAGVSDIASAQLSVRYTVERVEPCGRPYDRRGAAVRMNRGGAAVGGCDKRDSTWESHAASWPSGSGAGTDLDSMGNLMSWAMDVNDNQVAVGGYFNDPGRRTRAFIADGGGMRTLGNLPGGYNEDRANGINKWPEVVGSLGSGASSRAFRWYQDRYFLLETPPGQVSEAQGVNDFGTSCGFVQERAVRWTRDGSLSYLALPGGGVHTSQVFRINNSGWTTGWVIRGPAHLQEMFPAAWNGAGQPIRLPTLSPPEPDKTHNTANGLNDTKRVEIVGFSHEYFTTDEGKHGVLWYRTSVGQPYRVVKLTSLLSDDFRDYRVHDAFAINNRWEIQARCYRGTEPLFYCKLRPVAGTLPPFAVEALPIQP